MLAREATRECLQDLGGDVCDLVCEYVESPAETLARLGLCRRKKVTSKDLSDRAAYDSFYLTVWDECPLEAGSQYNRAKTDSLRRRGLLRWRKPRLCVPGTHAAPHYVRGPQEKVTLQQPSFSGMCPVCLRFRPGDQWDKSLRKVRRVCQLFSLGYWHKKEIAREVGIDEAVLDAVLSRKQWTGLHFTRPFCDGEACALRGAEGLSRLRLPDEASGKPQWLFGYPRAWFRRGGRVWRLLSLVPQRKLREVLLDSFLYSRVLEEWWRDRARRRGVPRSGGWPSPLLLLGSRVVSDYRIPAEALCRWQRAFSALRAYFMAEEVDDLLREVAALREDAHPPPAQDAPREDGLLPVAAVHSVQVPQGGVEYLCNGRAPVRHDPVLHQLRGNQLVAGEAVSAQKTRDGAGHQVGQHAGVQSAEGGLAAHRQDEFGVAVHHGAVHSPPARAHA